MCDELFHCHSVGNVGVDLSLRGCVCASLQVAGDDDSQLNSELKTVSLQLTRGLNCCDAVRRTSKARSVRVMDAN